VGAGKWHVDVRLGEGVSYADAERIVKAIRRKQIVSRLMPREVPAAIQLPDIDTDTIRSISKSDEDGGRGYSVYTGAGLSGQIFTFRIARGRVELYSVGAWIV